MRSAARSHDDPELAFEEHRSAALLCDRLEAGGFTVERGAGNLPTAFRAEMRGAADGPTIAILAEYDALPGIGHACGHNLIAAASIGAGLAVASAMAELPGRILVVGTPAEERGDGKLVLESNGVFAGVDATMMVHPSAYTMVARPSLALTELTVEFMGKTAHAAAAPEAGISALEALLLTFNNINSLRLHLRPDARVHGIITHGGTASNIIPEYAAAEFSVRAAQRGYLEEVLRRVIACAEGAAASTGATLRYQTGSVLFDFVPNQTLARLFAGNWEQIGVPVHDPARERAHGLHRLRQPQPFGTIGTPLYRHCTRRHGRAYARIPRGGAVAHGAAGTGRRGQGDGDDSHRPAGEPGRARRGAAGACGAVWGVRRGWVGARGSPATLPLHLIHAGDHLPGAGAADGMAQGNAAAQFDSAGHCQFPAPACSRWPERQRLR